MFAILTLLATASLTAAWNASAGCNSAGFDLDSSGKVNRTLASGRQYLLHVPSDYHASVGHPAVLSFHGAGGTSANQEKLSQLSTPGLRIAGLPIFAAYPQGADNTDQNRTGVWYSAPYANISVDDIQFTKDVVADISDNYCINPKRIYASGKSNGGGFTAYMACRQDTTKIFAAFAPVSPALYNGTLAFSGCNPSRPIPIVTSHGVEDQTIPFEGRNDSTGAYGVGSATINVPLWRKQWAVRNGCSETSNGSYPSPTDVTNPYVNTTEYVWSCDAEIQAYTVSNLGHSWPTTQGLDSSGAPNNTASFNLTDPPLVDFFSKQTLPDWCFEDQ